MVALPVLRESLRRDLRAAGYATAICTNKPEGLAETLTRRLGIRDLFGSLIGADTLLTRKPDPAPYLAAVHQAGGIPAIRETREYVSAILARLAAPVRR